MRRLLYGLAIAAACLLWAPAASYADQTTTDPAPVSSTELAPADPATPTVVALSDEDRALFLMGLGGLLVFAGVQTVAGFGRSS